ncbi:alpha/beta fold hydrolase [Flavisphingomonas formosensis]|uniref:alpha/beta fold hydrolase n=1 Tax=Flavisphingomonas formosensis TaxID=861534 RepID=UPI0018DFD780|nr:alpha/beta fold hydrolase [Sphingomonas formosensis]
MSNSKGCENMGRPVSFVETPLLRFAYHVTGSPSGRPVVLLHGFPYDARSYGEVSPLLAADGFQVIVPYLRGYGETTFLHAATFRSGEQAALGQDLLDLVGRLGLERPIVGGYVLPSTGPVGLTRRWRLAGIRPAALAGQRASKLWYLKTWRRRSCRR